MLGQAVIVLVCISTRALLAIIVALYKKRIKLVFVRLTLPLLDWLAALITRRGFKQAISTTRAIEGEKLTVPYGVAIFVGVCVAGGIVLL
jgi:hypothetical protein